MKSRITIEVDFKKGNTPCIQVISVPTEDVRDKLIKNFFEQFATLSEWCKVDYTFDIEGNKTYRIHPIQPKDVEAHMAAMKNLVDTLKPGSKPLPVLE